MPEIKRENSFLDQLMDKKAMVLDMQARGLNVKAALNEVNRQIKQCLTGGYPIKGEGVTKSGEED